MNDNKQHDEMIEDVRRASLCVWNCEGLVSTLTLLIHEDYEDKQQQHMKESIISLLSEKIEETHALLASIETQMLHQITND